MLPFPQSLARFQTSDGSSSSRNRIDEYKMDESGFLSIITLFFDEINVILITSMFLFINVLWRLDSEQELSVVFGCGNSATRFSKTFLPGLCYLSAMHCTATLYIIFPAHWACLIFVKDYTITGF